MSTAVTFGADTSAYQNGLNIGTLVKQGFEFFAAKCTEGAHTADSEYPQKLAEAKANQVLFVAYHFLHSDSTPEAQAQNLADHIIDKRVHVMVDVEVEGSSRPNLATANAFRAACAKHGIEVTLIYDPHFWWSQTGAPSLSGWALWQAEYPFNNHEFASVLYAQDGGNAASGWAPEGGVVPTIWQFASGAKISGYAGSVDVDAFRGTRADLAATGLFTDFAPAPVARPVPAKPSGPTRIAQFHQEYASKGLVDLGLLDAAVNAGRTGTVKSVRDYIDGQAHRVPNDSPLTQQFHRELQHRVVDMNLLRTAVSRGRTGTIHDVFHNIQSEVARLPNA